MLQSLTLIAALTAPAAPPPAGGVSVTPAAPRTAACGCADGCRCAPVCDCGPAAAYDPLWFALRVRADGGTGSGTPVYTDGTTTLVLTNAHVARQDRTRFSVETRDGKVYATRRVDGAAVSDTGPYTIHVAGDDLAVVAVDADLGAVPVAAAAPAPGDPVFMWGYGGGAVTPPRKSGTVVSNAFVEPTLTATLVSVPGDSGAGVFNTRGELVGVNHGTGAGYGMHAVPLGRVRTFLSDRPVLTRLFPRLADRVAARREQAQTTPQPAPAAAGRVDIAPAAPPPAAAPAPACPIVRVPVYDRSGRVVGYQLRQQCPSARP